MSSVISHHTDILIYGASLEGLLLALSLQQQGHIIQLIDQHERITKTHQSILLSQKTLGLYRKLGIDTEVLSHSQQIDSVKRTYQHEHITSRPFHHHNAQDKIYSIDHHSLWSLIAQKLANPIIWQTSCQEYKQRNDHIICTIQTTKKNKQLRKTSFLILTSIHPQTKNQILYGHTSHTSTYTIKQTKQLTTTFPSDTHTILFYPTYSVEVIPNKSHITLTLTTQKSHSHAKLLQKFFKQLHIPDPHTKYLSTTTPYHHPQAQQGNVFLLSKASGDIPPLLQSHQQLNTYRIQQLIWRINNTIYKNITSTTFKSYNSEYNTISTHYNEILGQPYHLLLSKSLLPQIFKRYITEWYIHHTSGQQVRRLYKGIISFSSSFLSSSFSSFSSSSPSSFFSSFSSSSSSSSPSSSSGPSSSCSSSSPFSSFSLTNRVQSRYKRIRKRLVSTHIIIGQQAPSGYLVTKSNQPKIHRSRIQGLSEWICLLFVGSTTGQELTDQAITLQQKITDTYGNVLTTYVVTNDYNISQHDDNSFVLGDPEATLHKKYHALDPLMVIIRPDETIVRGQEGFSFDALHTYATKTFIVKKTSPLPV